MTCKVATSRDSTKTPRGCRLRVPMIR
jgi:hypothetical protein